MNTVGVGEEKLKCWCLMTKYCIDKNVDQLTTTERPSISTNARNKSEGFSTSDF